ncbi:PilZ domain-containing protein [Kaarinaea lacus]
MMKNNSQSIPVLVSHKLENQKLASQDPDKREDHRHSLTLDAEVHFVEQDVAGMFRCRTQNIGLHGAFLPSNSLPVESNMFVEVVLKSGIRALAHKNHRQYRLQAQVVHTSDQGAGLAFKLLDQDQLQDFRRFLFKAKVAARH